MQKTIYSLPACENCWKAANRRYLEFLSAIADPRAGRSKLDKLSQPVEQQGRRYSGFNLAGWSKRPEGRSLAEPVSFRSSKHYCFNFSQKFSGLTKIITSPGLAEAVCLPHALAVTTPSANTCFVEKFLIASQE